MKLLLFYILFFAAHLSYAQTADEWYQKGMKVNDPQAQINCFTKAIELNCKPLAPAYYNRGVAHNKLKHYESAIKDYTKAITLKPDFAAAYYNRGSSLFKLGNNEAALKDFSKSLDLNPKDPDAYFNRGMLFLNAKHYSKAITDFDQAIAFCQSNCQGYYSKRAETHFNLRKFKEAVADYSKVIELDPNNTLAYSNRGLAFFYLGNYKEAVSDYTKVLESDDKNAFCYHHRANALIRLGKTAEGFKDFEQALVLNPKDIKSLFNRGVAYCQLQQFTLAIPDFDQVIQFQPNYAVAYRYRALAKVVTGKGQAALTDINAAISLCQSNCYIDYDYRAYIYYSLQEYTKSMENWEKVQQLAPTNYQSPFSYIEDLKVRLNRE